MALSAEQIEKNYQKHLKIIDTYIGDRKDSIKNMLSKLEGEYVMAPASGRKWYHNAFAGGYVSHVNRVVEYSIKQKRLYEEMGGIINFTEEELVFAALFHDLGKIGDGEKPNFIPQTDKWRQDKLSEMYSFNPDIDFMLVPDRSLFLLQKFGIKTTQNEYIGIRVHDGVFDKSNEAYFFSNMESSKLKSNLVHILHTADYLASKVEYDMWKQSGGNSIPKTTKVQSSTGKTVKSSEGLNNLLKNI